jgi:hypothetical protein
MSDVGACVPPCNDIACISQYMKIEFSIQFSSITESS